MDEKLSKLWRDFNRWAKFVTFDKDELNDVMSELVKHNIENFLDNNLNEMIKLLIVSKEYYYTHLLCSNIKKIDKRLHMECLDDKNKMHCLLKINHQLADYNDIKLNDEVSTELINYINTEDDKYLYKLINISIDYNKPSLANRLKDVLDLKKFYDMGMGYNVSKLNMKLMRKIDIENN